MPTLRDKMARHGFESNDDYELPLRCLLDRGEGGIRCLNVAGDSGRRKTAFATALAHALEIPRVLYHDFTQQHPPLPDVILPRLKDEMGREEPPMDPLDQIVSEACAFSEAEESVLILDQLQAADFREHIRIYRFLDEASWRFRDAAYYANPAHLLVLLISEQPLYHSLQQRSFRVWVSQASRRALRYAPEDFGLGPEAAPLLEALAALFEVLECAPIRSEYARVLRDIERHVRSAEELRHCLYGRVESMPRPALFAREMDVQLERTMGAARTFLGMDEVELSAPAEPG